MGRILITGGAGFIGCNIARRFLDNKADVIVIDNLSRAGASKNLNWLKRQKGGKLTFIKGDIRNKRLMDSLLKRSNTGKGG